MTPKYPSDLIDLQNRVSHFKIIKKIPFFFKISGEISQICHVIIISAQCHMLQAERLH